MTGKKQLAGVLTALLLLAASPAFAATAQYAQGDSGQAVEQIQKGLAAAGYFGGQVDGKFSTLTREAVYRFQKDVGLKADGIVDEKTYKTLTGRPIPDKPVSAAVQVKAPSGPVLATALSFRGVKYRFGGASPDGFDCSGFVMYVFNKHGIKLPRTADKQFEIGTPVKRKADLIPGDLVFFETYERGASHVGIYRGNDQFVHASSSRGVTVSGLSEAYYSQRYLGARRVL